MHIPHRRRASVVLAVALMGSAVAAFAASGALSGSVADSEIDVTLGKPAELHMKTSVRTANAGEVAFAVTNRGKLTHEFIVLRTRTKAAKLKPNADEPQKVQETGFTLELEDIEPGHSIVVALPLKKGHYVLLCNIGGHHAGGMHADLSLK